MNNKNRGVIPLLVLMTMALFAGALTAALSHDKQNGNSDQQPQTAQAVQAKPAATQKAAAAPARAPALKPVAPAKTNSSVRPVSQTITVSVQAPSAPSVIQTSTSAPCDVVFRGMAGLISPTTACAPVNRVRTATPSDSTETPPAAPQVLIPTPAIPAPVPVQAAPVAPTTIPSQMTPTTIPCDVVFRGMTGLISPATACTPLKRR
ncbi:MAG: hypothetical protein WA058_00240 [Minisyncoccia bacterium]